MNPPGYWTKERCLKEALKYTRKQTFKDSSKGAYMAARRNNWIELIWAHMELVGNKFQRCVYAYEFPDNHVYIGLTCDLVRRDKWHNMKGPVFYHTQISGNIPTLKQLTPLIDRIDASIAETTFANKYKDDNWILLNRKATGELGGNTIIWTREKCLEAALLCKTKSEFLNKFRGAHRAATIGGWLNACQQHMIEVKKPKNYWTKEKCAEVAKLYNSTTNFRNEAMNVYIIAHRRGWYRDITLHFKK